MARLRREWGYQWRAAGSDGQWQRARWAVSRRLAERLVANGPGVNEERRLVWRIVSDAVVEP